ncbi:MAG: anthranilate phosphoribosyltransferase [Pseudonocardiales bacterium]|nr:anthranilate phosphoribosyltransferase [Pseudonocardiales bacterium]
MTPPTETGAVSATSATGAADTGERSWPGLLSRLLAGTDLTASDTAWVMDEVLAGDASDVRLAGFLTALRAKGETAEEIAGLAEAMLSRARRVPLAGAAVDVVGTGGDHSQSVNISSMAAIVVAAAGVPVVKHGNRAASSRSGAADLLEALGVAIDLPPDGVSRCLAEVGIGFCFAPVFHPAMRYTATARRELGVPTAMNLLGPLTNPAQPPAGLIGCADLRLAPVIAAVLAGRGASALVVRGDDGLDEITTTSTTSVWLVDGGAVRLESLDVAELGVPRATAADLRGGDATFNADVARRLLAAETGPVRDAVLVNAAGAVAAFTGLSDDLLADLRASWDRVVEAVDSGAAAALLARWAELSSSLRGA